MRKLAMAGVLAAAALFAQGTRADDAAKERREAADATREQMKQEGRETRAEMERGAQQTREAMRSDTERTQTAQAGRGEEKRHPLFEGKNNFDLEGKIQKVSKNTITVSRDELPAATLTLSRNTKIELDGDQVSASQLKPGQDVKASFNLRGDKPEAIEIKAEKTEMQEQMKEQREERREERREQQEERREQQQR